MLMVDADFLNEYRDYVVIENTLKSSLERRINAHDEEVAQAKADADAEIDRLLEAQASKLLIEITGRCKEITETLVEEAKKEVASNMEGEIERIKREVMEDVLQQCFEGDNGHHVISTVELEQLKAKHLR